MLKLVPQLSACPPHKTTGNNNPKIPASKNGIINFIDVEHFNLEYKSWVFKVR